MDYIGFDTEISGRSTIRQFFNLKPGEHSCTQLGYSWSVSSSSTATWFSCIHPVLTKLWLMWQIGTLYIYGPRPCKWARLLSFLSKVTLLLSACVGSQPRPNLPWFSMNLTKLAVPSPFRPKPIPGSYPSLKITRATIKEAPDRRGCTGGASNKHYSQFLVLQKMFPLTLLLPHRVKRMDNSLVYLLPLTL